jgi:hypothetical protein
MSNKPKPAAATDEAPADPAPEATAPESDAMIIEDHTDEAPADTDDGPYARKPKVEKVERAGFVIETYL